MQAPKNGTIQISGNSLSPEIVYSIATAGPGVVTLVLSNDSKQKMHLSREFVLEISKDHHAVYGINTGFGALSDKKIKDEDLAALQLNLIRSHCVGVGEPFSREITRAIMLIRANCLAAGFSGVNPELVELLLAFLNHDIIPVVPSKGSVGASGDLAPLAHIALALVGEGDVVFKGKVVASKFAMEYCHLKSVALGPKDGLSLINGTAVMAALASMAIYEAEYLAKICDIAGCLTLEAVRGTDVAFRPNIQALKPHPGQIDCAQNFQTLIQGSAIRDSHRECGKVQDPYSLRCIPQVHGACRQTLSHAQEVISIELNAVTDNPLVFADSKEILSGGNFHGEALALAMDYMCLGLSEFCNISERRVEKMMNPVFSELPAFLTSNPGLNSGLMMAHVTAAALVSENKYLSHPASVDSIPTSTDKEDHVSMGVTAGLKLHQIIVNLKNCLAIEFLCNTQAMEFFRPLTPGPALLEVYRLIRAHVRPIETDRVFSKDIQSIRNLIETREMLHVVENKIGALK